MKIVEYTEEYGEVVYPQGFEAMLRGKTVSQQMQCFRTAGSSRFANTNWPERTAEYTKAIEENADIKAIVIKDGLIAGVIVCDEYGRDCCVRPEEGVCTYYARDNNGAGYKTRADYLYLICVPEQK